MSDYRASTYGDRIAARYDEIYGPIPGDPACIDFLVAIAGKGPALELGIGTGRVALPLAARGVVVHGIDASKKIVAKLRAKKGGKDDPRGDRRLRRRRRSRRSQRLHARLRRLQHVLRSLQTQDDQVRCFENVARRLAPGGTFVVEGFVPDPARFDRGQRVDARWVGLDEFAFQVARY